MLTGGRNTEWAINRLKVILRIFSQEYTYTVKICDPERRSKFILRDMHNVSHKFASVRTLQSALYHEFDDQIPDGDFNVGYFEGSSHKKKWLVSADDLTAMYAKFKGKKNIPLWCDGKEMPYDEDDEEEEHSRKKRKKNKDTLTKKVSEQEEELESVFQKLRGMHENKWSGPQYRLWARAIVSGVHENIVTILQMHRCLVEEYPSSKRSLLWMHLQVLLK